MKRKQSRDIENDEETDRKANKIARLAPSVSMSLSAPINALVSTMPMPMPMPVSMPLPRPSRLWSNVFPAQRNGPFEGILEFVGVRPVKGDRDYVCKLGTNHGQLCSRATKYSFGTNVNKIHLDCRNYCVRYWVDHIFDPVILAKGIRATVVGGDVKEPITFESIKLHVLSKQDPKLLALQFDYDTKEFQLLNPFQAGRSVATQEPIQEFIRTTSTNEIQHAYLELRIKPMKPIKPGVQVRLVFWNNLGQLVLGWPIPHLHHTPHLSTPHITRRHVLWTFSDNPAAFTTSIR
jgi:hypothetical protein